MVDEDTSVLPSPDANGSRENLEDDGVEKELATFQTYIDSLPYAAESIEEMQAKLETIVGRIAVCAVTKNWNVLTTWDGMLQCWLLMRYPMTKPIRAKLVRLYYELALLPGIEARVVRAWADMLSRLLANKVSLSRKLEVEDLQLPWEPLWRSLQKELWPTKRLASPTRNVVNILLYLAEQVKRYFPAGDIPEMLETFIPVITKDSILTMIPVLTSFLPPTHTHLYLPSLLAMWEAFNSNVMDDRLLELAGALSEEHVSGRPIDADVSDIGPSDAEWKEVGIWTEKEWAMLVGKGLGSLSIPVGASTGSGTASLADAISDKHASLRIKKVSNRNLAIAKLIVYSIAVDGPVRVEPDASASRSRQAPAPVQVAYVAGSKALDSLDKLITSTESFFHPSNSGVWTLHLTALLHNLCAEFYKRWEEERLDKCKTPITHRLTPSIRRAFVSILRTPALLAMFAKDPTGMAYAAGALRTMSMLEPSMIMPELLERAYSGLEVVNETHRTTAVLCMLGAISQTLVSESVYMPGPKHVAPLLELCLPGIDLNDPSKTMQSTAFISSIAQRIKLGDLSIYASAFSSDGSDIESMDVDEEITEGSDFPQLSREDERSLTRDSTAAFADWIVALFRRVFAVYENLPEEGGRSNKTGGKDEEAVLKSIKSMLDVVCLHLSDELFTLALNLVYDYATTNARSNSVRAFGQLVSCLARVKPKETMAKFLPFCISQIEDELKHGASSVMTTSSHGAIPSDTTLHWNMSIMRGCLGYGGSVLLKHKTEILGLMSVLVEKTKTDRGYSSCGRLISRVLHTLGGTYPINPRFVNSEEWESEEFRTDHNLHWGRLHDVKDVKLEWHVPSAEEIKFIFEILDTIGSPSLEIIERLSESTKSWDNANRNDFCRHLHAVRSIWSGLGTLIQQAPAPAANPCLNAEIELPELLVSTLDVKAGFALQDPSDPRYQKALAHRTRFGAALFKASQALQVNSSTEGEDHTDAVLSVAKSIDVYLLEYGLSRGSYDAVQKHYIAARDAGRLWSKQKELSRVVIARRAQMYHSGRIYMHALYRRRSAMDDQLLGELLEMSLSPYTRVRRHAQSIFHSVCGYYVRSTRLALPRLFDAVSKGNDPDRIKGALYVLGNAGTAAYALTDHLFHQRYLVTLLKCEREEKPSIQKLVGTLSVDCLAHMGEEAPQTDAYQMNTPGVDAALEDLATEFTASLVDHSLLSAAQSKATNRIANRNKVHSDTVNAILEIASGSKTHWRYVQMASRFLSSLIRRDVPASPELARFFTENSVSPQPTIRIVSQRAITKIATFIKLRTYATTSRDLWLDEWKSPLRVDVSIEDPEVFLQSLETPIAEGGVYIDKLETGFLSWTPTIKAYRHVPSGEPSIVWAEDSREALKVIQGTVTPEYLEKLALLWGQESNKTGGTLDIRPENVYLIKTYAKMFEHSRMASILAVIDPLLSDSDRYKQRAGAEFLAGILRGAKHWPQQQLDSLWEWTIIRFDQVFPKITPDTVECYERLFQYPLSRRDPRRNKPLVDWILNLPLEFEGDSAFAMSKSLSLFSILSDTLDTRLPNADKYTDLFFKNLNTGYAEIRAAVAKCLWTITKAQWHPRYPTTRAFLLSCNESKDPLTIRKARYENHIAAVLAELPEMKKNRLAPPRVAQSDYDKVGLTLLTWLWVSAYSSSSALCLLYAVPMMPQILLMSELNDSSELAGYAAAVLYVLSAVTPPPEYVEVILDNFLQGIKGSTSWRIRLNALQPLVVFFYRNLLTISPEGATKVMDVLLDCLADENVEVREMASKVLSGVIRCSQRHRILPLKQRFVALARKTVLPPRKDPKYGESLRVLHSAILGLCALIDTTPYSVEPWMPSLTEVLAPHATAPPPISTTIRKCASEFKKTHQDTWARDKLEFDEDQLQSLSTMLVGTSYYA